jgi:sulfofructose kinase
MERPTREKGQMEEVRRRGGRRRERRWGAVGEVKEKVERIRRRRREFDVVGVGYTAADFLGTVPHFPRPNTKLELTTFRREGGGPTATAMVTVARLGGSACFIGKMGDDDLGSYMRRELEREGVDTSSVRIEGGASSQLAIIMVDATSGDRTILWTRGTLAHLKPEEIERDWITAGKVLHLDTHELPVARQAAGWAREARMKVVVDAGTPREGTEDLVPLVDYLICSERFPRDFTGIENPLDAARKLLEMGPPVVVTTLGPRGAFAATKAGELVSPGFMVPVVDTTGAGDVFHGAFSYGITQGWEIPRTLDFANAAAALKCRALGGRQGIPRREEVDSFLASGPDRIPSSLPRQWGRNVRRVKRR